MDRNKNYASFSIPKRDAKQEKAKPIQVDLFDVAMLEGAQFAEIEIVYNNDNGNDNGNGNNNSNGNGNGNNLAGDNSRGESIRSFMRSAAHQAQPIAKAAVDPIREKFFQMRSLAYNSPLARNDAGLFYRQAKYMEDFEDAYSEQAQFSMYYPNYQHMGYEQLRTYFTWRTKIRKGIFAPASLSYYFLYIYELLSGIGAGSPAEGADKLEQIWKASGGNKPALDKYMPQWLKDYHIYYILPYSFTDFIDRHGLHDYYPELYKYDAGKKSLWFWNDMSSYDISKSAFYSANADKEEIIIDCFDAVLYSIRELCVQYGTKIDNILTYGNNTGFRWYPFQRALFHHWYSQQDRIVELPGGEKYRCKHSQWTSNTVANDNKRSDFVGYLIKKTEACLRQVFKYKYKINADPRMATRDLRRAGIPVDAFDKAIEDTVERFYRDLTKTVVTVDHDNLARIRKEALGTQDKLTVPEGATTQSAASGSIDQSGIVDIFAALENDALQDSPPDDGASVNEPETDEWQSLKEALTDIEHAALSMALRSAADIKSFADENSIMLEVLIDGINEKAADHIGDSILELGEDIIIYDDYKEQILKLIE